VLLREFSEDAELSKPEDTRPPVEEGPAFLATRVDAEGDLSRLLDGVHPFAFDADGDRKLDKTEAARAFFSALDLDGDKGLTPDELSRHPGELRQLRYRGPWAAQHFAALDDNKDGKIQVREFKLEARDFAALDRDRNGFVELGSPPNPYWEARGILAPQSEWPTRRPDYIALPPGITRERVLAQFDADKNGSLSQRELKKRLDLFVDFDRDGDQVVTAKEIDARINALTRLGIDAAPDGFLERWDLDGDGKLTGDELPEAARIAVERKR
jgi:Ca2+-binding EF-hand superfamily protein